MKRLALPIAALALLAACGADGEPVPPTGQTNVYITSSGVSAGTSLSFGQGPFRMSLGVGL